MRDVMTSSAFTSLAALSIQLADKSGDHLNMRETPGQARDTTSDSPRTPQMHIPESEFSSNSDVNIRMLKKDSALYARCVHGHSRHLRLGTGCPARCADTICSQQFLCLVSSDAREPSVPTRHMTASRCREMEAPALAPLLQHGSLLPPGQQITRHHAKAPPCRQQT